MAKFRVGDKVVGNKEADKHYLITKTGWVGTVVEIWDDGMYVKGDGLRDKAWVDPAYFDLVSKTKEKVYLQYDGKTTRAALVAGGKNGHLVGSGETNCSPADDYDTVIGTLYAVLRLAENMGYDIDKLYGEYKSCGKSRGKKAKKEKKEKKLSKKEKLGAKTTKAEYVFHDGKLVTNKAEQEKIKEYCRKKIELLEGSNFDEDVFENAWKATRKWFNF